MNQKTGDTSHHIPQGERARFSAIQTHIPEATHRLLDVGCVRHSTSRRHQAGSLHDALIQHINGHVTGIDIDTGGVNDMQADGYDARHADATTMALDDRFDVIVAGEVVEHVPNPGRFLATLSDHLTRDGRVVLTTPNPDGFVYLRKALRGESNNETHTCWIDPTQLQQLAAVSECGLEVSVVEFLPPTGGISSVLWRAGVRRGASPTYLAVLTLDN